MPVPQIPFARIALLSLGALAGAPAVASASSNGPYLTWQNKTPVQSTQPAPVQTPAYDVPPSPYGQVGDPYRHTLTWPTKNQPPQPAPRQASLEPAPRQADPAPMPPMPSVSVAVPRPMPRPEPVTVAPQPEPEDEDDTAPAPQPSAMAAPAPAPTSKPVAASATAMPVSSDSSYQVPTTSKYAARIAAARAAQAQQLEDQPSQDAASPAGGAAPAQASAGTSLASQETDHVFIPGEQITDAVSQEPRRYSLHRQYGLNPDPIEVDRNATGALLETHFDALDPQQNDSADDSSHDSGTDPDGDGQNAKP